jgi:hypothetical protein
MINRYTVFLAGCIALVSFTGCHTRHTGYEPVNTRSLQPFLIELPEDALPGTTSLETVSRRIGQTELQVSFISGDQLGMSSSFGVVQPLRINRDHRYAGVTFSIKTLSAPCTLMAAIVPRNTALSFLHAQPLHVSPHTWHDTELLFADFTHTSTRLHLDTDSFNPILWDDINLFLVFLDCDNETHGLEWGPVKLMRRSRLYRFF